VIACGILPASDERRRENATMKQENATMKQENATMKQEKRTSRASRPQWFLPLFMMAFALVTGAPRAAAVAPQSEVYQVTCHAPKNDGKAILVVKVSYIDELGKKQKVTLSGRLDAVSDDWTAEEKAQNLHDALVQDVQDKAVGGQPLLQVNNVFVNTFHFAAAPDSPNGSFSDVKVEQAKTDDAGTLEDDAITPPQKADPSRPNALAILWVDGDITGQTSQGTPSTYEVVTGAGTITIPLSGSSTRLEVASQLRDGLLAQGATAWLDLDSKRVFVLLDRTIAGIGAGSDDSGIWTHCLVIPTP